MLCFILAFESTAFAERPIALNHLQDSEEATADRNDEKAALAFVKEHHAELASLLIALKERNKVQYRAAIRDLNRTHQRLEQFRNRSEQRYEVELKAWKIKSRIQLLTARLQMGNNPAIRKELLAALKQQAELRLATLELERERIKERLQRIEEQIERIGSDVDASAEQRLKLLLNKLDETQRSRGKSQKPRPSSERP